MSYQHQSLSFSKALNPSFTPFPSPSKPLSLTPKSLPILSLAGRSKKKSTSGRIEGNAELRRKIKQNARRKSQKLAESLFYRLKNPNKKYPDNFTEDELNMIGLGYDRMVWFMEKDDPNLRHPYDWYKYGEYGPYSWRGVVIGEPIRGGITDECVTMYSEVKDQEEWEKIEQFDMEVDYGEKLKEMDEKIGFRRYWVFVRHPRWRLSDLPWEQWTLVSEVTLEASKEERLDKWSLMGRLGNKARQLITKCAAWFRPDIIYVKRPVYQCRFEPQDDFFRQLVPLLDPETERDVLFELRGEDGSVEWVSYYEGLCKIVKVNRKAFVDDVVNSYEKMSDEKKSRCLEFLLSNHPMELLHPYTKEWKAKLEEEELGCDAPDDDDDGGGVVQSKDEDEFLEWIEDDGEDDFEEENDNDEEENVEYWDEKFRKALGSAQEIEKLAKQSVEMTTKAYKRQLSSMGVKEGGETQMDWNDTAEADKGSEKHGDMQMEDNVITRRKQRREEDGDETFLRGAKAKVSPEEWKYAGIGRWRRRIKKSKLPPELFLRAAVRPFTYRNLVKEIVLTRHAILDGEIGQRR